MTPITNALDIMRSVIDKAGLCILQICLKTFSIPWGITVVSQTATQLQVIARMGHWSATALDNSYLNNLPPAGLLAAGGWPSTPESWSQSYYHNRFRMVVPDSLKDKLFPFMANFKQVQTESYPVSAAQGMIV